MNPETPKPAVPPDPESRGTWPRPKVERRHRAAGRPGAAPRRGATRYSCDLPVRVLLSGQNGDRQECEARAHDISDGGVFIDELEVPPEFTHAKLVFDVPEGLLPEEYDLRHYEIEGDLCHVEHGSRAAGVVFDQPLSAALDHGPWLHMRIAAVGALFLAVALFAVIKMENIYSFWFDIPVFVYSLAVGSYLISRFLIAGFYRPPRRWKGDLPRVSVLVPVLNEERFIDDTLRSILESAYPAKALQVICVDDGSTDDTLAVLRRLQEEYPELGVIALKSQSGKREAIASAFRVSDGEIIVLVDSDSLLEPHAIRNLIDGFADPRVGAVSGHCEVANQWTNTLTRMQSVRYYVSFRILKAAESVFGAVSCVSGPLAAYRRDLMAELIPGWLKQTFLGKPTTFGDDRSMTNRVLKRGYDVIYDARACCRSIVPETYGPFLRQQLRWKRSWLRESLKACGYFWRREPFAWLSFYLGFALPILGPLVVFRAVLYVPIVQGGTPLMYLFGILIMSALMSAAYLFAKRSRLWIYGVAFCFFYMFVLVWQLPWAMLTMAETRWGSRASEN